MFCFEIYIYNLLFALRSKCIFRKIIRNEQYTLHSKKCFFTVNNFSTVNPAKSSIFSWNLAGFTYYFELNISYCVYNCVLYGHEFLQHTATIPHNSYKTLFQQKQQAEPQTKLPTEISTKLGVGVNSLTQLDSNERETSINSHRYKIFIYFLLWKFLVNFTKSVVACLFENAHTTLYFIVVII